MDKHITRRIPGLFILLLIFAGCAPTPSRFADAPPVTSLHDDQPSPLPEGSEYEPAFYYFNNLIRNPALAALDPERTPQSQDVNALDEVPETVWWTPRLGYTDLSPDQLVHENEVTGAPQPPYTVVRAKKGGTNPGFFADDARGIRYLVKFDPPEFNGIQTTTSFIVNRLFWGFGYNVPEDYQVFFKRSELSCDPKADLNEADVNDVLSRVAPPVNGEYRATFSMFLSGKILGPVAEKGTREGNSNDFIPHENRRVLRALHVFCAFTNHSDIRIDNSLDIYHGEPGDGYTVPYMLDFGEAFGGHAAEHKWLWDGYAHAFSYHQMALNYITLGLYVKPWERLDFTIWPSVGSFESEVYNPEQWRETYQYVPIRRALPEDDYWAAKILAGLTDDHISALVDAAQYPEPEAAAYVKKVLRERRDKTLVYAYSQVSPFDPVSIDNNVLTIRNTIPRNLRDKIDLYTCEIIAMNLDRKAVLKKTVQTDRDDDFLTIDLSAIDLSDPASSYLVLDVIAETSSSGHCSLPARFHFLSRENGVFSLIGVEHGSELQLDKHTSF